jgi:hypothetical protein
VLLAQRLHDRQDLVVGLALRQARRRLGVEELGLEEQLAAGLALARLDSLAGASDRARASPGGSAVEEAR